MRPHRAAQGAPVDMQTPAISIDPQLHSVWPHTALGCVFWSAPVAAQEPRMWQFFTQKILPGLRQRLECAELAEMPQVGPSRKAFKAFGRDPGRVRISSEALYRRVRQGKELYRINTAVDANNLISLETGFSLGTYDLDRLHGDIALRTGRQGEAYAGIGKEELDLCRMPLLADEQSAFGCPCSDSRRAMIAEDGPDAPSPRRLLTVIYGFSGPDAVSDALSVTQNRLEAFAAAQVCASSVIC